MQVEVTCKTCGKLFFKTPYQIRKSHYNFCSKDCHNKSMQKQIAVVCETCGKPFARKTSVIISYAHHYCSNECYVVSRTKRVKVVCEICGVTFLKKEKLANSSNHHYCSKKCTGIARRTQTEIECSVCGKIFFKKPSLILRSTYHYCSVECHLKQLRNPKEIICKYCGKKIIVPASNKTKTFCSMQCKSEWQSENKSGKDNPQWKGGISFEPYCHKFNDAFKESIRDKFNRECFLCSKNETDNGKKLSVHHANYDKNCMCNDVKCEFVPLCQSCHAKTNHNRDCYENHIIEKLNNMN